MKEKSIIKIKYHPVNTTDHVRYKNRKNAAILLFYKPGINLYQVGINYADNGYFLVVWIDAYIFSERVRIHHTPNRERENTR